MQDYAAQWGKRYHFDNIYNPMLKLSTVDLFQAGEIIAGDGYEISAHEQICAEISYVVSGCCDFYTDDQVFRAKQGDIHVISAGRRHKIVAGENDNLRMAYIGFCLRPQAWGKDLESFYRNPPAQLQNDRHYSRTLFEQLLGEIYAAQPYATEAMDACITQILIQVWRIFEPGGETENRRIVEEARIDRMIGHTVFKALRYIDNHISTIGHISEVAEALRYNPSYLSRVFREKTGKTLSRYIQDKKIESGKAFIREGMSVGETAARLGYASSQSFCKMFTKSEGCSPTAYLEREGGADAQAEKDDI